MHPARRALSGGTLGRVVSPAQANLIVSLAGVRRPQGPLEEAQAHGTRGGYANKCPDRVTGVNTTKTPRQHSWPTWLSSFRPSESHVGACWEEAAALTALVGSGGTPWRRPSCGPSEKTASGRALNAFARSFVEPGGWNLVRVCLHAPHLRPCNCRVIRRTERACACGVGRK